MMTYSDGLKLLLETSSLNTQVGPELQISPILDSKALDLWVCTTLLSRMLWDVSTGGFRGKIQ